MVQKGVEQLGAKQEEMARNIATLQAAEQDIEASYCPPLNHRRSSRFRLAKRLLPVRQRNPRHRHQLNHRRLRIQPLLRDLPYPSIQPDRKYLSFTLGCFARQHCFLHFELEATGTCTSVKVQEAALVSLLQHEMLADVRSGSLSTELSPAKSQQCLLFPESGHNFKDIRGKGKLVLLCNRGVRPCKTIPIPNIRYRDEHPGIQPPLRQKHVWSIRTRLQIEQRTRDLAMFNLAIDSKLRGCDVVAIKVEDVAPNGYYPSIGRPSGRKRPGDRSGLN